MLRRNLELMLELNFGTCIVALELAQGAEKKCFLRQSDMIFIKKIIILYELVIQEVSVLIHRV